MNAVSPPVRAKAKASSWAGSAALAAVALLFVLPFVLPIRRAPLPTLDGEMLSCALLGLGALAACAASRAEFRLQWPLPAFLLLLAAVAGVQWLTGRLAYSYSATTLFMAVAALAVAYGLGRWLRENTLAEAAVRWISVALVAGALLSVVVQLLQLLDVRGLPALLYFEMERNFPLQPVGNIGQPNQMAAYLALAIPAAVHLARGDTSSRWMALVVAIAAAGVALTLSRMGVLMLILLGVWLFLQPGRPRRWRLTFVGAIGVGFVGGLIVGPLLVVEQSGTSMASRFLAAAYGDRTTMWTDAVRIALDHPLLGAGVGEYAAAQYWVASPGRYIISTPYAHNAFLQFAGEFGLPVAVAFAVLSGWWFLKAFRPRWLDPARSTVLAFGALLFLHGMLEWSLWVLFVSIPAALLFALAEPETRSTLKADPRASLAPLGLAALLYLPVLYFDYDDVARLTGALYQEHRTRNRLSFNTMVGTMQLGAATYFKPQADRLVLIVAPIKPPVEAEDVARTARVLSRSADAGTIGLHISTLALAGRVDEALPHVERLRAFAATRERYELAQQEILAAIAPLGARAEPLRASLAAQR